MLVNLDIFEMSYLLDSCLRGSHLRAGTVKRFVDEWFDKLTEQERYNLYEWSLRLTYSYPGEFRPSEASCGADIVFMSRYDPDNQFWITTKFEGKEERHLAFVMDHKYYVKSDRYIADKYITHIEAYQPKVERTEFEENFNKRRH